MILSAVSKLQTPDSKSKGEIKTLDSQLHEFAIKSHTHFVRNVRPLCLFPELYKGKDGNQRLPRDTRYLKISYNGKIPEATADERDRLQQLICAGELKVVHDTGMPDGTENFLVHKENEVARLERIEDSDLLPQKVLEQ